MSPQDTQIYELPGDVPPVELPGTIPPAELPGDLPLTPGSLDPPLPTPFSAFSALSSHPSLRPRPLNFSRPRLVQASSYQFRSDAESETEFGATVQAPLPEYVHKNDVQQNANEEEQDEGDDDDDDGQITPLPTFRTASELRETERPRDSIDGASIGGASIDDAIPPPIRTYADLRDMDYPRDSIDGASIDEAMPPPIRTIKGLSPDFSTSNLSRGDSIYEDFPAPPATRVQQETYRKDSQVLSREGDTLRPSFLGGAHPLARMDTQSSVASSFDESLPPPISTIRIPLSHKDTESSKETKTSNQTKSSRGDSVIDATWRIPKKSAARTEVPQTDPKASRVCIYKPYLDYASSQQSSSARTSTTLEESNSSSGAEDRRHSVADSESSSTGHSSVADFAFDGRLGWNSRGAPISDKEAQRQQRWSAPINPLRLVTSRSKGTEKEKPSAASPAGFQQRQGSATSSENTLSPATSTASLGSNASNLPPKPPPRVPRIIKRTSIDQMSERVNPWQGESMSDGGSISSNEWTSSEVDTSGLSIEKIHKLKKKGINPALYVEMKNARKGKSKWISPLQGNSFIS